MSDRVRANTLFFFVVGYAILPLCLVRNLPVENFTDGVMTITNRTVQWVIFHAASDTAYMLIDLFPFLLTSCRSPEMLYEVLRFTYF